MKTFKLIEYVDANVSDAPAPVSVPPDPPPPARPAKESPGRRPDAMARAVLYLAKCEPAVSGQGGHDALFAAACRTGPGFDLTPGELTGLLAGHYNPACQPPWSDHEIAHKVKDAYEIETRRGWLFDEDRQSPARDADAELALAARVRAKIDEEGFAGLYRDATILGELAAQPEAAVSAIKAELKGTYGSAKGYSSQDFKKAVDEYRPPDAPRKGTKTLYFEEAGGISMVETRGDGDCSPAQLANFTAKIAMEEIRDDGEVKTRRYRIYGTLPGGETADATVPASDFGAMGWVAEEFGAIAIIEAGRGMADHAAKAIQWLSGRPPRKVVFTHTGWTRHEDEWFYLSGGGAIGADGLNPTVTVDLTEHGLSNFRLPEPPEGDELIAAVRASLGILKLGQPGRPRSRAASAVLVALPYRAALRPMRAAVQLIGVTGSHKSCLAALAQQHFGPAMDYDHLPIGWKATAVAIQGLCYAVKDSLLVIDDFNPKGSHHDRDRMDQKADDVFRSQGNGQGRRRGNRDGSLQRPIDPRGSLLSTGEELPVSASANWRTLAIMVTRDVSDEEMPGTVDRGVLTACQADAAAGLYAASMAGFVRWVAGDREGRLADLDAATLRYRPEATSQGDHGRTPVIVADLAAGFDAFLAFARSCGAITPEESDAHRRAVWAGLMESASDMRAEQAAVRDAGEQFVALIQSALSSGRAFLNSRRGDADSIGNHQIACGWRKVGGHLGSISSAWEPHPGAVQIGWYGTEDTGTETVYLIPDVSYRLAAGMLSGHESMSPSSEIRKELHQSGKLAAIDSRKDKLRRTCRRSIGGRQIEVLAVKAAEILGEPDEDLNEDGLGEVDADFETVPF